MLEEIEEKKKEEEIIQKAQGKKKRGRKPNIEKGITQIKKEQTKFFVDLTNDNETLGKVFSLLNKVNEKDYGAEITFKDIAIFGISKINQKDIEKLKDNSLSEMEKVQRLLDDYNKKNSTNLGLGEFLVKKLAI